MADKVIVTVPVTGSFGDRNTPFLPITPKEIAESALDAKRAGASVAHIHVRDVETGAPSMEFKLYKEVVDRIRDKSDMLINLSTGPGARFVPDDKDPIGLGPGSTLCIPQRRVEHVLRLKPELCSLDVGSMNFGAHVFVNILSHVETMLGLILDAGIRPELEVFDVGHIEIANHLLKTTKIPSPPLFQLCMGVSWGIPASAKNMILMKEALPSGAVWAAFGVGASCFPMVAQSVLLGGHIRVGMEDNLYIKKGERAETNRELVEKAVRIVRALDKEPAEPEEVRNLLKIG
ncbi:MAG: 3-keto-5-aminohexanoate cleavage protein [Deltaproteobacteria bacterium]|nr:3-keto-5-aminohexanoate cleavage protein [Deltaproteobacteria bacterium]MBW1962852.1 3-keto-5-aminohexanoate cleavage protein [Deltaproteobacteria bacterium]MBW1993428.1 3-keto-5-aminohexanoate cleavage protein [Deltaproteobacteria bacterium]MBW2150543.1 3-keto-5-aminohexanoate cleavage protein [Deltaproteobacteria bacterium]